MKPQNSYCEHALDCAVFNRTGCRLAGESRRQSGRMPRLLRTWKVMYMSKLNKGLQVLVAGTCINLTIGVLYAWSDGTGGQKIEDTGPVREGAA